MLFDSDVLVWLTRGHSGAGLAVEQEPMRAVSIVGIMELIRGARDRRDLMHIQQSLTDADMAILPLSESIGNRAATILEESVLATGIDLPDALIAATAVEYGLPLCTSNRKHYKAIRNLRLKVFRP